MSPPNFYGSEWSTFVDGVADLDPLFSLTSGERTVQENCARRLMTPNGSLDGDPNFGFDLRTYLAARMTPLKRARMRAGLEAELRKEERIDSAIVTLIATDPRSSLMRIVVVVATSFGTFLLTLVVTDLTVALLEVA